MYKNKKFTDIIIITNNKLNWNCTICSHHINLQLKYVFLYMLRTYSFMVEFCKLSNA